MLEDNFKVDYQSRCKVLDKIFNKIINGMPDISKYAMRGGYLLSKDVGLGR